VAPVGATRVINFLLPHLLRHHRLLLRRCKLLLQHFSWHATLAPYCFALQAALSILHSICNAVSASEYSVTAFMMKNPAMSTKITMRDLN